MDFVSFILLGLGILIGFWIRSTVQRKVEIIGSIQIDHDTGLCKFSVTKENLSDLRCQQVIFNVDHNAVVIDDEYI